MVSPGSNNNNDDDDDDDNNHNNNGIPPYQRGTDWLALVWPGHW